MVRLYTWSDGAGCWMHHNNYNTKEEAETTIEERRYDPRYCKIEEA